MAVIVGIIFATFLTLILVPVLYSLVSDLARFFRRSEPEEGSGDSHAEGDPGFLVPPLVPEPGREGKVAAVAGS